VVKPRRSEDSPGSTAALPRPADATALARRAHAPRAEWLYARLYCDVASADRVLVGDVAPLVAHLRAAGAIESWFFVRHADAEPHLRLHLRGEPRRLSADALPALAEAGGRAVDNGRLTRFVFDTYVRDAERYGGDEAIILCEELFHADSEAAVAVLGALARQADAPGSAWKLALCGVDLMLDDLGMERAAVGWTRLRRDALARELPSPPPPHPLGERFRRERDGLVELRRLARSAGARQHPALAALRRRSERFAPVGAALGRLDRAGWLAAPFGDVVASLVRMHVNRVLRSQHLLHEYVVLDFLHRLRYAEAACRRAE
jgi:thiopeptide-type bacteriocin biosynthesis protein